MNNLKRYIAIPNDIADSVFNFIEASTFASVKDQIHFNNHITLGIIGTEEGLQKLKDTYFVSKGLDMFNMVIHVK